MARDPTIIVMGEDVAGGQGADGEMDAWGGPLGVTKGLYITGAEGGPGRGVDQAVLLVGEVVQEGQEVYVKLMGFDDRGKVRLSMKNIDQESCKEVEPEAKE